jgi:hypothetical protein
MQTRRPLLLRRQIDGARLIDLTKSGLKTTLLWLCFQVNPLPELRLRVQADIRQKPRNITIGLRLQGRDFVDLGYMILTG